MAAPVFSGNLNVKIPTAGDKVYKEECVLCFATPESEDGLYICMNSLLGFCRRHVECYYSKTSNSLFLNLLRFKKEIEEKSVPESAPTKLAIGLEGGFDVSGKKYEYEDHNSVVILPEFRKFPLTCPDLPESVLCSISAILQTDSASIQEEAEAMQGTWDGNQREVTKHANTLVQLNNGVKIPPKDWQCQVCGLKTNLWLNLTDGAIHCGRKYFNNQGGNNHAVEHYEKTKYPLVVKLGTITSESSDVYSYDEDSMVIDPNLPHHLGHFGINIKDLQKTDKSMVELEIDLNQRIGEWAIIQEQGTKLVPLYGPGYTGLENLGNSCYLNSVMQVVFNIPDFQHCYYNKRDEIFAESLFDAPKNFNVQMAKLAYGLLSGEYSKPPETKANDSQEAIPELPGIKPRMFKNLIGQGHPEFSTKRQQDAQEFFLHLISVLERHTRGRENPADALRFQVEERVQCVSNKVKYTTRTDYLLSLHIPFEAATNAEELKAFEIKKAEILARGDRLNPDEIVRPKIPLQACLESFAAEEIVDDFYSTALNDKTTARKKTRLRTFPDYLLLHLKKFTIGDDWVPKKLDVSIDVPEILDLSVLRGKGIQPGEEELPEAPPAENEFEYNEALLYQLSDMGFPLDGCKRALYETQNRGIDEAMNWVMEHMNDEDFSDPSRLPGTKKNTINFDADPEAIATIVSMGFSPAHALKALQATNNSLERAVDWIFSHAEEMDTDSPSDTEVKVQFRDGSENHDLEEDIHLVDVVNDLQNKLAGHALNVPLPQIVIVGSPSAGKSSVVESFVGRAFLPRGEDLVIRRPTVVQMYPSPYEEYAVFSHKPDVRFSDFKAVREEIESENGRHPGATGFTSDPIILKIFSPHVQKLTVVDLPELIKNVEDGQAQEVREMVLNYTRPQESIILAVPLSTQEMVDSDVMEIAAEVDPIRERTIVVMTELDGADAQDILENHKLFLEMAYVGIVSRNQEEIEMGKDFLCIVQNEFFSNRPEFKFLKDVIGVPYLIRMLQKTLCGQIKQFLPKVRSDISQKLAYHLQELRTITERMGEGIGDDVAMHYMIRFVQNFIDGIETQFMETREGLAENDELPAGSLIHNKLTNEVRKNFTQVFQRLITDDNKLDCLICSFPSRRSERIEPMRLANDVCRVLLRQCKNPMEESVRCIKETLENVLLQPLQTMQEYPSLESEVRFKILQWIEEEAENTEDRLINHLDASAFCTLYDYLDDGTVFDPEASTAGEHVSAEDEVAAEVHEGAFPGPNIPDQISELVVISENVKSLVMKKLTHLHKQMQYETIKYIKFFLIKKVLDFIKGDLIAHLLESPHFDSIKEDFENDIRLRKESETICELLQEALNAIPDF